MEKYKVAVIGAGASGLMAAYSAARELKVNNRKCSVVLLEGNLKAGKKLLATGNGRCNLTNNNLSLSSYHGDVSELVEVLDEYTTGAIKGIFDEMGLLTTTGSRDNGLIYPNNYQAASVLKSLLSSCEELGVVSKYEFNVFSVLRTSEGFTLKAETGEELYADKCIIASGGKASPAHSCGMRGYEIARQLGHSVTPLNAALVPLKCNDKLVKALKGIRSKAMLRLKKTSTTIYQEEGEIIFGDMTVSGICVFNASSYLTPDFIKNNKPYLELDFIPGIPADVVRQYLNRLCVNHQAKKSADLLSGIVNIKLGAELTKKVVGAAYNPSTPISSLGKDVIEKVVKALKCYKMQIAGLGDFKNAQVTAGGVPMGEITVGTMESKKQPGLYFAGEILNINGMCGGFNLHFAWATGMRAGKSAAKA